MKKLWNFFFEYKLFSLAVIALLVSLGFEFSKYFTIARWILAVVAIIEVIPLLWGMFQDLREGTYGIDILAATAIISSVILKQDWAGMVIVLMLTGGESLEDYAERRAKTELDALLKSAPKKAHLLKNNKVVDVKVSQVQAKQKIVIRPGEVVPVDAKILDGSASFDESSLTGESVPQPKSTGEEILSGSINLDGVITAQALRPAADSQYEQIIKLVKAASNSQSPFVRLADRYAIPFTIVSFAIAIAAWAISRQAIRFLDVLVVATPCPLILAAPIAVISGMSLAAKNGIIIKTGSALEKLAEAKTIGFDKTGTLTDGRPVVKKVKVYGSFNTKEVLGAAASLEQNSIHVLARAILNEAKEKGVKVFKVKKVNEVSGSGLSAQQGTKSFLIGRLSLMQEKDIEFPKEFTDEKVLDTATFVAINGKLAGLITFEDNIRKESKITISRLKKLGVKNFLMVTGDSLARAKDIAKQLGIKDIKADALPADKLRAIEAVTERPVVFVGDGVNDAPVLTASDVGIALGARGSTAASESADMVIMLDDVERVAQAREIAHRTFYIAKQSILVGILLSIVLQIVFSTGHFRPVYGAVIQEAVDVIVIFNSLRAHGPWKSDKIAKLKLQQA